MQFLFPQLSRKSQKILRDAIEQEEGMYVDDNNDDEETDIE